MILSIIALLLGIVNLVLFFKLKKSTNLLSSDIKSLKHSIENTTDWVAYYKKDVEKKINYLVKVLNKKFNKNV